MDAGSDVQGDPAARDAVLEAFHEAWATGETLDAWVARYPAYALELANLALALARQQAAEPTTDEIARAATYLQQAMDDVLNAPGHSRPESS